MIIGERKNQEELKDFVYSIRSSISEWQVITVKFIDQEKGYRDIDAMIKKLFKLYENYEGIIFSSKENMKAVMVVRLGTVNNYSILKTDIENNMPEHNCRVIARKLNSRGMQQIQIDLKDQDVSGGSLSLYEERERRSRNVFMIADDDTFIRKTIKTMLGKHGEVVEVDNGDQVIPHYLNDNPDVIILDIHMPAKDGLSLLNEIIELDSDAFILQFSSDSNESNVLQALNSGAAGFLAKPVKQEKLLEYVKQCITVKI